MIANAATYVVEAPILVWFWPLLAILGIIIQILGAWRKLNWPILSGLLPIIFDAWLETDPTLLIGDLIAVMAFFLWNWQSAKTSRKTEETLKK